MNSVRHLRSLVDAAAATTSRAGLAVGVTVDTATVLRGWGAVAGEPVGSNTLMYGGSLAKQMVGLLFARAVGGGLAGGDDHLLTWLPELPGWMGAVRLAHLLHHTSGLPDVVSPHLGVPGSNEEVIERFQRVEPSPAISPGVRFSYNNAGYVLLAEAIARSFRRPIHQLAREELFNPLGLTTTRLGGVPRRLPAQPDPPGTIGDGGLWTSVADLTDWLTAMNSGDLDAAAVRRVETPGRLTDGTPLDYGGGVRIVRTPYGPRITHGGSWAGWQAKTLRLPERRIAVAILSVGSHQDAISELGTNLAMSLAARQDRRQYVCRTARNSVAWLRRGRNPSAMAMFVMVRRVRGTAALGLPPVAETLG